MTQKKVSIRQIADDLGISPSTVSRALNDHPRISQSVKDAVLLKAQRYNYHVSSPMQLMIRKEHPCFALILPQLSSGVFQHLVEGAVRAGNDLGYRILIIESGVDKQLEQDALYLTFSLPINGAVLFLLQASDEYLSAINNSEIPLMLLGNNNFSSPHPKIVIDNFNVGYLAAEHILRRGSRHIVFLAGDPESWMTEAYQKGIKSALKKNGEEISIEIIYSELLVEDVEKVFFRILSRRLLIDAFIVQRAKPAIALMRLLNFYTRDKNYSPRVISLEDADYLSYYIPSITAIQFPLAEIGKMAIDVLHNNIGKKTNFYKNGLLNINPKLIIRNSTL